MSRDFGITESLQVINKIIVQLEQHLDQELKSYQPYPVENPKYKREFSFDHNSSETLSTWFKPGKSKH